MQIQIYHCDDLKSSDSEIYQTIGDPMEEYSANETTLNSLYSQGWKLREIIHKEEDKYTLFLEKD